MPRRRPDLFRAGYAIRDGASGLLNHNPEGNDWFFRQSELGGRFGNGKNPDEPSDDMSEIFGQIATGDTIWIRGKVLANLTQPASVNDITIVGAGTAPRHGSASNVSELGAAAWHTASGVTDEPLLIVKTQGWRIVNLLMAPPSADAAIELQSDGGASPEKTVSGFTLEGCRIAGGKWGINDNGGSGFVRVWRSRFETQTTASIQNTSTSNALPLGWDIDDTIFGQGSASHIIAAASKWTVRRSIFATVASTAKYIDFTGGANNTVGPLNVLAGTYDTTDYVPGTSDVWAGNFVIGGVTTANPTT